MVFLIHTPPPAPRRDHRDGERPRGARLRWQDGHCHKKPTRGAIQNLKMKTKLPYKTQRGAIRGKDWTLQCLISSLYNALVHHHVQYWICIFQVISQSANFLLTKHFGQSIFIFWQSIFIFWQRICTFQVISQSANFLLTKSRAQARPDLSTTYFDLDDSRFSLFSNYHISSYLFRHELQNKIILDESGYFAFEHYLSKVLNPQLMWQKDKIDKNCFNRIIGHYNAWSVKWSYGKRQNYMNVITTLC